MMKKKVMAAMSGGVDSSVAAYLAREAGYGVVGATMKLWCPETSDAGWVRDIADARAVCGRLGLPHTVLDCTDAFRRAVIGDFATEYAAGRTPNPCVVCNKRLKFGLLLDAASEAGCDAVATGHFARVERDGGRVLLKKAADGSKDQSYMLWQLSQEQLSHVLLPLGGLRKAEVRDIAAGLGLVTAHKSDSQDICFVPDGDYAAFLTRECGLSSQPGSYVDETGHVLGQHKGIIHYTVGQRKGLGIALGQYMYVADKCAADNTVTLVTGDSPRLFRREVALTDLNLIAADRLDAPLRVTAKLRYRHAAAPALLTQTGPDTASLVFDEPQRAPAPGQSAVFYDGDVVVGGGIIK